MRLIGRPLMILYRCETFRLRHIHRLTALRTRQFNRRHRTLRLLVVNGLLLRNVSANARRHLCLKVLRWLVRVTMYGTFLLNVVLRGTVGKGCRDKGGLALVNGSDGLIGMAIGDRLHFRYLQQGMFSIKNLRRIFSALHRVRVTVLRVANVAHIRPAIAISNDDHYLQFLMMTNDSDLAAGGCLIILTGLRLRVERRHACKAGLVTFIRRTKGNDHEFHRAVTRRRICACEVRGLTSFVKRDDAYHEGRVAILGACHLLRRDVGNLFMRLMFRVGRRQEDLSLTRVVGIVHPTRLSNVRRRHLARANFLKGLLLRANVSFLPGAKCATRRYETCLFGDDLSVL